MVELLAPVGSKEAFYAAIENKADAVYLGGKQFGARAYANNFELNDLKEMIKYAHLFNVKVYVTINTIVFDEEIEDLIEFLDFLYLNDCDAVIVQDYGVLNILKNRYPDFEVHASTQMNIHSVSEAKVLKELGVKRIVVAREINIDQIKKIKKETNLEIEAFIHGALCVSSSGKCYMSSIIGKRSGNRGRCAQPCRLPFTINEENGYLISPKDLYSLPRIKELVAAGVDSFKIEGRMKRPEYVAQIVRSYRSAIDNYYFKTEFDLEKEEIELRKIFNRDFTKGFLFDEADKDYINKESSNHQGILVGKVINSKNNTVKIKLTYPLNKGDSVRLVGEVTDAITINQMYVNGNLVELANKNDIISLRSHIDGLTDSNVYLTSSFKQLQDLEKSYLEQNRKVSIDGIIDLKDDYLRITLKYNGYSYELTSDEKVQTPKNNPTNERILEQFSKINNTVFVFNSLVLNINKPIFINIKTINELRRKAIDEFTEIICVKNRNRKLNKLTLNVTNIEEKTAKTIIKVRNFEQLSAALNYNFDVLYVTDKTLIDNDLLKNKNFNIFYCPPRVDENDDVYNLPLVANKLGYYKDAATSVYMNTTNAYTVNLLENLGAKSIGLSFEMSMDQIETLIYNYKKLFKRRPNLEMNVYGRIELMMIKYKLGLDKDEIDGSVNLVDRKNYSFPMLLEDEYVKILNSKKLHLIDYLDKIKELNISTIIDFTIESTEEVRDVMDIYFKKMDKRINDVTIGHTDEGVI